MEYVRIQDDVVADVALENRGGLSLSAFPGEWHNTNQEARSSHIRRIILSVTGGELAVRVFAASAQGEEDWGIVKPEAVYAAGLCSSDGMCFTALFDLELMQMRIGANINQGLLVVAMFGTWKNGGGRSNWFGREFFHRSENGELNSEVGDLPCGVPIGEGAALDLSLLVGTWANTYSASRGIATVMISESNKELQVRVFGAGTPAPIDWGEVRANAFVESLESRQAVSFSTFYDFGFIDVHLQTYVVKGVLVVVSLSCFKDSSRRSNYFNKEFFYRR